jgi:hypothetical protein
MGKDRREVFGIVAGVLILAKKTDPVGPGQFLAQSGLNAGFPVRRASSLG